jgi:hypothetical protein
MEGYTDHFVKEMTEIRLHLDTLTRIWDSHKINIVPSHQNIPDGRGQ